MEVLAQAAAVDFIDVVEAAVRTKGRAAVALSGGSTPRALYRLLAAEPYSERVRWANVHIFWGDERCVPPDHPDSNYLSARQALLEHVPIPAQNIHRMSGEDDPETAARNYETELRAFFSPAAGHSGWTSFDLAYLGLGEDAHTASLFPGTVVLNETERWVAAHYVLKLSAWRITLTAPLINQSARVRFLVSGAEKRWPVQKVLYGSFQPERYPAQLIRPAGETAWLLDDAAAALL